MALRNISRRTTPNGSTVTLVPPRETLRPDRQSDERNNDASRTPSRVASPSQTPSRTVSLTQVDPELARYFVQRYENTYRTEPDVTVFPGKISRIIKSHLEDEFGPPSGASSKPATDAERNEDDPQTAASSTNVAAAYEPAYCSKRACALSEKIKADVKQLGLSRYRIVCVVQVGEEGRGGVKIGSRCLWNSKFDRWASATHTNGSIFAVGTVYAVYLE